MSIQATEAAVVFDTTSVQARASLDVLRHSAFVEQFVLRTVIDMIDVIDMIHKLGTNHDVIKYIKCNP